MWILLGVCVLLLAILLYAQKGSVQEGFITVDLDTATAQRQNLQMEGERRYNDFARVQSPNTKLSPDLVDAALQQAIPVPNASTFSLLNLFGSSGGLGAADDGSNKQGAWVEQTGVVADKIAYCESLPVNCDTLNNPAAAECGFCHKNGTDSKGKPHRGGMYISSDDLIRANEIATANGVPAIYKPTVGSCDPRYFTTMSENCQALELQMQCQVAGAATSNNPCGQCYGGSPAGGTGLLYVGPKPREYTATLWVSHPGSHSNNGSGLVVTYPNGSAVTLPYSNRPLMDPQALTLQVTEGDVLKIDIYGMPMVWCGWLSNDSGTRTVSLDIGEQTISPPNSTMIVGDKRAQAIQKAVAQYDGDAWASFQNQVPNTVMWYGRRDEAIVGAIKSAWYGNTVQQSSNAQGVDVTDYAKMAAGAGMNIPVSNDYFQGDPAPGIPKHVWITPDRGAPIIAAEGQTVDSSRVYNHMQMIFQVPATLVEPIFADDKANCPSGPLVFTEVGAGLMGAHSCFKPDGSFNATQYCLQELFQGAGGTQQGTAWPNTDAKVKALVVNNSLDDTVAAMNNLGNIALYGIDQNGAAVSFATFKDAAMRMLGKAPMNPCDTADAAQGPQTPECLDFLWRTSGNTSDPQVSDPNAIPYNYCNKEGMMAPLNADGSINQANINTANGYGSVPAIRGFYNSIFNRANDSSNFDNQVAGMRDCYNVNVQKPAEDPSACPLPNPTDWQCFPPEKLFKPELFSVCPDGTYSATFDEAEAICGSYGARVATPAEISTAQGQGAQWCACSWANDGTAYYPMNTITPAMGGGCGSAGVNNCGNMSQSLSWGGKKANAACVSCVGMKPPQGTPDVQAFNTLTNVWNNPMAVQSAGGVSDTAVPAGREVANQVVLATDQGGNILWFPSNDACETWATAANTMDPDAFPGVGLAGMNPTLTGLIDQYVRGRV